MENFVTAATNALTAEELLNGRDLILQQIGRAHV